MLIPAAAGTTAGFSSGSCSRASMTDLRRSSVVVRVEESWSGGAGPGFECERDEVERLLRNLGTHRLIDCVGALGEHGEKIGSQGRYRLAAWDRCRRVGGDLTQPCLQLPAQTLKTSERALAPTPSTKGRRGSRR